MIVFCARVQTGLGRRGLVTLFYTSVTQCRPGAASHEETFDDESYIGVGQQLSNKFLIYAFIRLYHDKIMILYFCQLCFRYQFFFAGIQHVEQNVF